MAAPCELSEDFRVQSERVVTRLGGARSRAVTWTFKKHRCGGSVRNALRGVSADREPRSAASLLPRREAMTAWTMLFYWAALWKGNSGYEVTPLSPSRLREEQG